MKIMTPHNYISTIGNGRLIMFYSDTGKGKTTSIIQSIPKPALYIGTEKRSIKPSLDALGNPDFDMDITYYEEWDDFMKFLSSDELDRYAGIIVDSFTHLMSIDLSIEVEDEAFGSRAKKETVDKPLASQSKLSQEGYGVLSSQMFRLMRKLEYLSAVKGKVVVVTALLQENPKWNRELTAAPALKGREFPTAMAGFFDLIGLVESRTDKDDNTVYPPNVFFDSPKGDFVAKYTGKRPNGKGVISGVLDISKILGIKEGVKK